MAAGRIVTIDAGHITDRSSFHTVFAEAFGFPDWYGRNMDAWIDLMTWLDEDRHTTGFFVAPGEVVTIHVVRAAGLRVRAPELHADLVECSAFVNRRRIEAGGTPYLCLSFDS